MSSSLETILSALPDVSFIDSISVEQFINTAIKDYEDEYFRLTGKKKTLYPADPMRLLIYTYALKIYQMYQYIDKTGKQDLLKYSRGEYLDNIAALRGVTRLKETQATVSIRFHLAAYREEATIIPKGTRVTSGDGIFFATDDYTEIEAGYLYTDIPCTCIEAGTKGNSCSIGQLNMLVDSVPYIAEVFNITVSSGGIDTENDTNLAERIFLSPGRYSVAGAEAAYIYWVKSFSQLISDVKIISPSPGCVDIRVLLENGTLPDEEFLSRLQEFISRDDIRPLTDLVTVGAPEIIPYSIELVYYIKSANKSIAEIIKSKIDTAIESYTVWQKSKIGRDINPSELTRLIMEAGAKRVEIMSPIHTHIPEEAVAVDYEIIFEYGGVENE